MIDMSFDRLCVHIFECETDMRGFCFLGVFFLLFFRIFAVLKVFGSFNDSLRLQKK